MAYGNGGRYGGGGRHGNDSHGGLGRNEDGTGLNTNEKGDTFPPVQQRLWQRDHASTQEYPSVGEPQPSPDIKSFLQMIGERADIRGLYDRYDPSYAQYQGMRANIAALHQALVNQGLDEAHLQTAADAVGEALYNDTVMKRMFSFPSISHKVANAGGSGAQAMYAHLLEVQDKPAPLQSWRNRLNAVLHIPDRNWNLPPMGLDNVAAPTPTEPPMGVAAPPQHFASRPRTAPQPSRG